MSATSNGYTLTTVISVASSNAATNTSVINYKIELYNFSNSFDDRCWAAIEVNGTAVNSFENTWQDQLTTPSTGTYLEGSTTVSHNATGEGTVTASSYFYTAGQGSSYPYAVPFTGYTAGTSINLPNLPRVPLAPAAPTATRSGTNVTVTSAVASNAGGSPTPPSITAYQYRESLNGTTWGAEASLTMPSRSITLTGRSATSFYYYQTRAYNSEGWGPWSATTTLSAPPVITSVNIPSEGYIGEPYVGSVSATNATSYAVSSSYGNGLPPGLAISNSGVIAGTPLLTGPYTFMINVTGPGGTVTTAAQYITIGATGPWVRVAATNKTITAASLTALGVATVTAATHGITQYNQPITISGLTSTSAALNGRWNVIAFDTNTVTFLAPPTAVFSGTASGTLSTVYKRGAIKIKGWSTPWALKQSPSAGTIWGATKANSLWVATGASGVLMTGASSDATTWALRTSGTTNTLSNAAYGLDLWVVVGANGTIITSNNGTSWTARTSGTTWNLNAVQYANSTWVAVGANGTILTSTNGTTWTARTSGTTQTFYGVAYGNSLWVAVGINGVLYTSPDATTWTSRTSGYSNGFLADAIYANGSWQIVGSSGRFLTSANGITWTAATVGTTDLYAISYGSGQWVVVGSGGTAYSSTDKVNWTVQPSSFGTTNINYLFYDSVEAKFLAVGDSGKTSTGSYGWQQGHLRVYDSAYTASDGKHWKPIF